MKKFSVSDSVKPEGEKLNGRRWCRDETDVRFDWVDNERHGAHCSRRVSLADVCRPGCYGRDRPGNVDWYPVRHFPVPGNCSLLRRNGETVSRDRQFLLLCRAVIHQPSIRLALCPT